MVPCSPDKGASSGGVVGAIVLSLTFAHDEVVLLPGITLLQHVAVMLKVAFVVADVGIALLDHGAVVAFPGSGLAVGGVALLEHVAVMLKVGIVCAFGIGVVLSPLSDLFV